MNKLVDSAGPFKVGQTLTLSSVSATDKALPPTSSFTVKSIEMDDGNYDIGALSLAGGTKTNLFLLFNPEGALFIIGDVSTFAVGAGKERFCVFPDVDLNTSPYSGFAAHLTQEELSSGSKAIKASSGNITAVSSKARAQSIAQMLAPQDNGPCTLTIVP